MDLAEHLLGERGVRVGIRRAENLGDGGSGCVGGGGVAGLERLEQGRSLRFGGKAWRSTELEMVSWATSYLGEGGECFP